MSDGPGFSAEGAGFGAPIVGYTTELSSCWSATRQVAKKISPVTTPTKLNNEYGVKPSGTKNARAAQLSATEIEDTNNWRTIAAY